MKYITKVFHQVNDYPMSIINSIEQQELNDVKVRMEEQKLKKPPIKFS